MTGRTVFEEEMAQLKNDIVLIADTVSVQLKEIWSALYREDEARLFELIEYDENVNELELEVNEKATLLIAKQQPVASDLRKILAGLRITNDLERIGDLAVDIAKAGMRIETVSKTYRNELAVLFEEVSAMLEYTRSAYVESDISQANHAADKDDEIDSRYAAYIRSLFQESSVNNADLSLESLMQYAFIARFLERIADYCTNISESIVYEVEGMQLDLNE
ncbi:phosphate signaling complex protein PhoU [Salisediminibacterium halotolerans]|uniref:Phosphate-specific transport system accessory protein PhoU n=1 Tax=Salisediminibacterium halotolerans TaxID=517425 RepID=A0A1H9U507_9BACI|nr:phosphate signaling complex protein PhoU [Salisediminibacterium haloalkalitolerans]SES04321.1 phosphate transport system protein [Salisediminibacterium haloalkalitolerans]